MEAGRIAYRNAQQGTKKHILILITNSFACINIIHSGLAKKLTSEYDVHLLSTMIRSEQLLQVNSHFDLDLKLIDLDLPREPTWITYLRRFEKILFAEHFDIVTQQIKYQRKAKWTQFWVKNLLWLISHKNAAKIMLKAIRRLIIFLTSFSIKLKTLLPYHFEGVISSSPLDPRENRIVNFCRRNRMKSLAIIISWDNMTSKGVINADHDYTLVWNDFMKNEFLQFYSIFNIAGPKVIATGIPRFDCYFQDRAEYQNAETRKGLDILPGNRVILIATSALRHFPNQLEIILDVLHFAEVEGNVHVIIRCHPADPFNAYNQLTKKKSVTIWHPKNLPRAGKDQFYTWFPELNFLDSLSETLRICDVCIQFASTMKLDAAACGKRVISIAYDGNVPLPHHKSVERLYDYNHQIPLNALQLDELVKSKEQLFKALKNNLNHRDANSELSSIKPFIHFTEAKSVDYTANVIAEWLD
ncbi:CDP-glycerol glycerophosphotransferase family protein [Dyadobacter sp. LJ53]|uniref:CDP-glycerol glycerophosphotransferase family protein n=1 Tax=Dyadobacter chenwenxiniae TaxID=2906456 RepID=UPI001F1D9CAB|nr:CDP-glycerol glycerophosphotransferase family protein [Dyadobacter chenwenxiniae]MCF0051029.1 CDP-glycerol glycerophosphotransferase family protein [Dyadobacter chenwenxiniae]